MVDAIRFHTTVQSEELRIPELAALVGRRVEILVLALDEQAQGAKESDAAGKTAAGVARQRTFGSLRGRLQVPEDFDAPLPGDVLRAFEGDE